MEVYGSRPTGPSIETKGLFRNLARPTEPERDFHSSVCLLLFFQHFKQPLLVGPGLFPQVVGFGSTFFNNQIRNWGETVLEIDVDLVLLDNSLIYCFRV